MSGLMSPVHLYHTPVPHIPPQHSLRTHTPPVLLDLMDIYRAESTAFAWCLTSFTQTWVVWKATSTSCHSAS